MVDAGESSKCIALAGRIRLALQEGCDQFCSIGNKGRGVGED